MQINVIIIIKRIRSHEFEKQWSHMGGIRERRKRGDDTNTVFTYEIIKN